MPWKPFNFGLAMRTGTPIMPISIAGAGNVNPIGGGVWIEPRTIEVTFHPLVEASEGETPQQFSDRVRAIMAGGCADADV